MVSLKILIYMYDKIKGTLHLNKITSLRNHTVDKPTTYIQAEVLHKWPALVSLPMTAIHVTQSSHYPSGKNPPMIPFFKKNQEKPNKRFKSWFRHPLQVWWFYEDKKNPNVTNESNVIHRGFFMYVQWLGKNYCMWEGTYLWFKA